MASNPAAFAQISSESEGNLLKAHGAILDAAAFPSHDQAEMDTSYGTGGPFGLSSAGSGRRSDIGGGPTHPATAADRPFTAVGAPTP